jgi:arylsulfatase A-like enzyme
MASYKTTRRAFKKRNWFLSMRHVILFTLLARAAPTTSSKKSFTKEQKEVQPNILVIMTDEHNFRTLGCYRELMDRDQAYIWGSDVFVDTPFIDSIAKRGALFTNFYSVSPTCTPSRGSFLTGTYPNSHGAFENDARMKKDSITFAQVLKEKLNYHTGYIGKFHLNGKDKRQMSFGAPRGRTFGFDDTRYQWNRGHWKFMTKDDKDGVRAYTYHEADQFVNQTGVYTTEFLVDRALEFIDEHVKQYSNPFALMLSLPDPHGPNFIHDPYAAMFQNVNFDVPKSAALAMKKMPALPKWSKLWTKVMNPGDVPQPLMDQHLENMRVDQERMEFYRPILGMVKAIDDNVGRILKKLKESNLEEDTVIVLKIIAYFFQKIMSNLNSDWIKKMDFSN